MPNERAGEWTVRGGGGTERKGEKDRKGGKERMKGGEEVLEAEFALSPIFTFGLQILGPLSSITRMFWWQ